jgi:hypothetical protein
VSASRLTEPEIEQECRQRSPRPWSRNLVCRSRALVGIATVAEPQNRKKTQRHAHGHAHLSKSDLAEQESSAPKRSSQRQRRRSENWRAPETSEPEAIGHIVDFTSSAETDMGAERSHRSLRFYARLIALLDWPFAAAGSLSSRFPHLQLFSIYPSAVRRWTDLGYWPYFKRPLVRSSIAPFVLSCQICTGSTRWASN